MSAILHTCPTCDVVISLEKAATLDLIAELEKRCHRGQGRWTEEQCRRLRVLADTLNPRPLAL